MFGFGNDAHRESGLTSHADIWGLHVLTPESATDRHGNRSQTSAPGSLNLPRATPEHWKDHWIGGRIRGASVGRCPGTVTHDYWLLL